MRPPPVVLWIGAASTLVGLLTGTGVWLDSRIAAHISPVVDDIGRLEARVDGVVLGQELANLRSLREARATLKAKAATAAGLTLEERREYESLENEILETQERIDRLREERRERRRTR